MIAQPGLRGFHGRGWEQDRLIAPRVIEPPYLGRTPKRESWGVTFRHIISKAFLKALLAIDLRDSASDLQSAGRRSSICITPL
jgi:hypothetical protein